MIDIAGIACVAIYVVGLIGCLVVAAALVTRW